MASHQICEIPIFVFMDRLPTVSECVNCIISYAPTYQSKKQKETVALFAQQIEELWHKAFSKEHVILRFAIKCRLDSHLKEYKVQVQKNSKISKRNAYKLWQSKNNKLFDLLKPTSNPENFDEDEKQFYFDQKALSRKMALSDQVDEEYDNLHIEQMGVIENCDNDDTDSTSGSCSATNSHENDTLLLTQSNLRSGKVRITKSLVDTQRYCCVELSATNILELFISKAFYDSINSQSVLSFNCTNIAEHLLYLSTSVITGMYNTNIE